MDTLTTLSGNGGSISNSQTSISVLSSTGAPSTTSTNFSAVIDDNPSRETVLVTEVLGTTWTVTRGFQGTTAVQHNDGVGISFARLFTFMPWKRQFLAPFVAANS